MSKPIPYLLQGKNIILVIDGESFPISKDTHVSYGRIVEALKNEDWDELRTLVDTRAAVAKYSSGNIEVRGNEIFWKGEVFHNALATRLLEMIEVGLPVEPMVNFMENLMKNPSKRSVDQLYTFLERNKLPITQDGHFLAFKKVRAKTYMDIHSNTVRNAIGDVVEMDRNKVDDNPNNTCSSGLHFCSESYLPHFGGSSEPVMILKIDPADVVSIPTDYNGAKGRCCKYTVVAEVKGSPLEAFTSVVNGDYDAAPVSDEEDVAPVYEEMLQKDSSGWPFPVGSKNLPDRENYEVRRVRGGTVEYGGLTLAEARALVEKNIRQKKAMLAVYDSKTGKQV